MIKEEQLWINIEISGIITSKDIDRIKFYPFENLVNDESLMQSSEIKMTNIITTSTNF